jgi:hypothetical protein
MVYPDQVVSLEEFVQIMENALADTFIADRDDFIQ